MYLSRKSIQVSHGKFSYQAGTWGPPWQLQWARSCWWGLFPDHQSVCLCQRSSLGCLSPCHHHTPTLHSTGLVPWPVWGWHSPGWAGKAPGGTVGHIPLPHLCMCTGVYSWAGSSLHSGRSCCCTHRVCPLTWLQQRKKQERNVILSCSAQRCLLKTSHGCQIRSVKLWNSSGCLKSLFPFSVGFEV